MKGIPVFSTGRDVRIDPNLGEHDFLVISVCIIVGEVDISILKQAVGNQKIVRLVAGKGLAG